MSDIISESGRVNRYKCDLCHIIINEEDLVDGGCPQCGSGLSIRKMCPNDHNDCSHEIVSGVAYCELCGEPVCPTCGSHDVSQVSRVTGYMADVAGWNEGKKAELKDRHRVKI